jgi:2-keto-4-pentenoate hydratase/2-oxohepta-3-ene-1,7-dioic acid hydratase in catechol pathway
MTKLATFVREQGAAAASPRVGAVLEDGGIVDLAAAGVAAAPDMLALIEAGPAALAAAREAASHPPAGAVIPAGGVQLLAPIPRPRRNVFCVGRNYMDHVAEGDRTRGVTQSEMPKYPQFFTKVPEAVIAPEAPIPHHAGLTEWLDYEVELVAVIGRAGRDIPREDALSHVFGWTIGNDVTARELQRRYGQWFKGKSLDGSCPLGPWIVPAEELDALATGIRCRVNGETRQDSHTSKMIFDVKEIIHQLSLGLTLRPGDVILTGTPEGVGYAMQPPRTLQPGDVVECEIDGIGALRNVVGG